MMLRLLHVLLALAVFASGLFLLAHTELPEPRMRVAVEVAGATLLPAKAPDMPQSSDTVAYGEPQAWGVLPKSSDREQATGTTLTVVPVHARRSDLLDLTDITEALPEMTLEGREDITLRTEGALPQRWATGRLNNQSSVQACLVPGLASSLADTQHEPLEQAVVLSQPPVALRQLRQVLGLVPSRRWECLLVTLSASDDASARERLSFVQSGLRVRRSD